MHTPSLYSDKEALYSDKEAFDRIARGEEGAFKEIFLRYKGQLFTTAMKMLHDAAEAEEVVQNVFLALWAGRANLASVENPGGYLFIMTHNRVISELRKIAADQKLRQALKSRYTGVGNTTEETLDAREKEKLIAEAVKALPSQRQLVYKLNRLEGLSYEEIARHLGISRHTVRNQLAEAVKSIRAYLNRGTLLVLVLVKMITNNF